MYHIYHIKELRRLTILLYNLEDIVKYSAENGPVGQCVVH